ncbi:hypothetical protein [Paracoccus sp. (in: a-proteobacteria)]|uniref:hypothetical protein n=1 Tax=Paracoccus sp. TaxID=267 RepID=UPI0026DFBB6C|nr:hypothetical protein [Paracoccus sp. (in: a-proteobacteria)]
MLTFLPALPGHAAGQFTPPAGCRLEVTVQNRGCTVSQHFRCDADPEGYQRSAIFSQDGLTYLSVIDAETRWIESASPTVGMTDTLEDEAEAHASLSRLIETGRDDFDFWTVSNSGERLHHQGWDELTGETVIIDGVELEQTRFQLTTRFENGETMLTRSGQQFISRVMGRFYGGVETSTDWTGATVNSNDSPVTFAFPGKPGFGSITPQYDCDMLMTQLSQGKARL